MIQEVFKILFNPILLGTDQVIKRFFNWFHQLKTYMQNTIYNQYRRWGGGGGGRGRQCSTAPNTKDVCFTDKIYLKYI